MYDHCLVATALPVSRGAPEAQIVPLVGAFTSV